MMHSEATAFLDIPRWHDRPGHPALDTDELIELHRLKATIYALPMGERTPYLQRLADRWGCSVRAIQRAIRGELRIVEVDGWQAVFRIAAAGEQPRQATAWRRVR